MADPFVGEIRLFGGNFAPQNWAFCNGQLLAISDNDTLFSLIGTTYGGDGQTTFGLPNLTGRLPVHQGQLAGGGNYPLGQLAGSETVTLIGNQVGPHTHPLQSGAAAAAGSPAGALPGSTISTLPAYLAPGTGGRVSFNPGSIQLNPGGQSHDNLMPYQCVSFIIALFGIYPTQN